MQRPSASVSSPSSTSFAGVLSALATAGERTNSSGERQLATEWKASHGWSDDGLEEDVATLSYERALRAHARYRYSDQPSLQNDDSGAASVEESRKPVAAPQASCARAPLAKPERAPAEDQLRGTPFERNLKSASITIRLSKVECAQLHKRAAEAGLSVSAYLRSCTFEAESLRAMVKDTMAEFRLAKAQAKPAAPEPLPQRSGIRDWMRGVTQRLARLLTPWQGGQRVARA